MWRREFAKLAGDETLGFRTRAVCERAGKVIAAMQQQEVASSV